MSDQNNLKIVEGTTRLVEIPCKNQDGEDFDFDGFTVQTYLTMRGKDSSNTCQYLDTVIEGHTVMFEIPDDATVGKQSGWYETRIFKDGKTYSVIMGIISVTESKKPDIEYHGGE